MHCELWISSGEKKPNLQRISLHVVRYPLLSELQVAVHWVNEMRKAMGRGGSINCQYNSKPICICLKNSLSLHQRRVCYGSPFFVSWFSWKPDKHGDSPQQAPFWLLICVKSRCNLRQNTRWFEADDTTIRPKLQAENTSFLKLRKNRTICISTEQSFLLQFFTIFIRVLSRCSFGWES